jgi:hypothetical protein
MNVLRFFTITLLAMFVFSCSTKSPFKIQKVSSPLGLYKSNTSQKYWIAIMQNNQYLLCSTLHCINGQYERVPANYGVILLDFYVSDIGLNIEKLSHGFNNTQAFYTAMKKLRLEGNRPNDMAFNVGQCNGIPCVGIGHTSEGVKFFRIEDFDGYWLKNEKVKVNE